MTYRPIYEHFCPFLYIQVDVSVYRRKTFQEERNSAPTLKQLKTAKYFPNFVTNAKTRFAENVKKIHSYCHKSLSTNIVDIIRRHVNLMFC
jgi:hypothetical protein